MLPAGRPQRLAGLGVEAVREVLRHVDAGLAREAALAHEGALVGVYHLPELHSQELVARVAGHAGRRGVHVAELRPLDDEDRHLHELSERVEIGHGANLARRGHIAESPSVLYTPAIDVAHRMIAHSFAFRLHPPW